MSNLVMYLRLSLEDDMIKDESNSITNQRLLITDYIRKHEDLSGMNVIEKCDDGYSGTNLNRPGMQEMLELVKQNKVDVIVVKDISRFARNYIDTGKYLEQIFPFMGVRFIAINDNYDSKDFVGGLGDIDVQFRSLLYDFVSRETSEKVKAGYAIRKAAGAYYSRCAPYGYVIDHSLETRIRVDEEAAVNVRRIFALKKSGKSNGEIARIFNEEGIPVPSVYMKKKFGGGVFSSKSDHPMWSGSQISGILRNETYAGTFVYDKYRTEVIGSRKPRLLPKSEWKRIQNHHEAIVTMEEFLAVQNEDATFFRNDVSYSGEKRLFTGIIICSQCGCNLQYVHSAKGRDTYRCKGKYTGGANPCKSHIFADEVELAVKEQLSLYLSTLSDTNKLLEERNAKQEEKRKAAMEHLDKMNDTKQKLEVDLRDAYENYAKRITDKETYLSQREVYDTMLTNLEEKRKQQEEAVKTIEVEIAETAPVGGIIISADGVDIKELTREVVETFIDKIVVYEDKSIEIRWKFQNPFA